MKRELDRKLLERITVLAAKHARVEGATPTAIPYLSVIQRSKPTPFSPGVLTPAFCLVAQGTKEVLFDRKVIRYESGDFIASMIDMPASGHIVDASKKNPYLGLRVDLTTKEVASVMSEARIKITPQDRKLNPGAFVGRSNNELLKIFVKLLELLDTPAEAAFLGNLLKREMIFRLLTSEYGHLFFHSAFFDPKTDGVGKVIQWIKANYAKTFTVEKLAKANGMSTSGLHHKFKSVTTMGPLQYQKQMRLQEARRILLSGSLDVTNTALKVGYESPSQFNREYRRLFGQPPLRDMKKLRLPANAGEADTRLP